MKINKYTQYWNNGSIWFCGHHNSNNVYHGIQEYFSKNKERGYIQTHKNGLQHGLFIDFK